MFATMSSLHDSEEIKEISPKSTILSDFRSFKYLKSHIATSSVKTGVTRPGCASYLVTKSIHPQSEAVHPCLLVVVLNIEQIFSPDVVSLHLFLNCAVVLAIP